MTTMLYMPKFRFLNYNRLHQNLRMAFTYAKVEIKCIHRPTNIYLTKTNPIHQAQNVQTFSSRTFLRCDDANVLACRGWGHSHASVWHWAGWLLVDEASLTHGTSETTTLIL